MDFFFYFCNYLAGEFESRPLGYKTFFMLNSTEHEISTAHKETKIPRKEVFCFKYLRCGIYHVN